MPRASFWLRMGILFFWLPGLGLAQDGATVRPGSSFAIIQAELERTANAVLVSGAFEESSSAETQTLSFHAQNAPELSAASRSSHRSDHTQSEVDPLRGLVVPILQRQGIPGELIEVLHIESNGNPYALSSKGALGLWQFMPETARRYGLAVNPWRDDRLDPQKSTEAAARYLHDLHVRFGTWPLAVAAYNAGEQSVERAMSRARISSRGYSGWLELLPPETRNYVPAVMGRMVRDEETQSHSYSSEPNEVVFALPRHDPQPSQ